MATDRTSALEKTTGPMAESATGAVAVGSKVVVRRALSESGRVAVGPMADFEYSMRVRPGTVGTVLELMPGGIFRLGFDKSEVELNGKSTGYNARGRFPSVLKFLGRGGDVELQPPGQEPRAATSLQEWWAKMLGDVPSVRFVGSGGTGRQYGGGCGGGYDPTWNEELLVLPSGKLRYLLSGMDESGFSHSAHGEGEWQRPTTAQTESSTLVNATMMVHTNLPNLTIQCTWRDGGSSALKLPEKLDLSAASVYLQHMCSRL